MSNGSRNYVLLQTDHFFLQQPEKDLDKWFVGGDCAGWLYIRLLARTGIERDLEPVMEDWGWTFAVKVSGITVWVSVWEHLYMEKTWLLGLEAKGRWFRRTPVEKLLAAQQFVGDAVDAIIAEDAKILKHAWFADNPFDLQIKTF